MYSLKSSRATKIRYQSSIVRSDPPGIKDHGLLRSGLTLLRVLQVRLRFLAVLVVAFLIVGRWDVLRNYWDKYTRTPNSRTPQPISADMEYFCPMCPGVVSDWPSKCPVCNMTLVRRPKGQATPLPDGVVARMQMSPYRLQMAGVQTSLIAYQPLRPSKQSSGILDILQRRFRDRCLDRTLLFNLASLLGHPVLIPDSASLESILLAGIERALLQSGMVLAVPESSVVDTGKRCVVYVESGPGMFDGVEVTLGRRLGDYYPVLYGLEEGQRVATAGAFLIDAETKLNPSLAAGYFGASRTPAPEAVSNSAPSSPDSDDSIALGLAELSAADRALAVTQRLCPVTGKPLGSMGKPASLEMEGRVVFLCCDGCKQPFRNNPKKYLSRMSNP
jgi:YHS domain-containing protein